jgi:putative flippase GtrA
MKYPETRRISFQLIMTRHIRQLLRFGVVGGLSTIVNSVLFVVIVDFLKILPILANLIAFLSAFLVSYFGHSWWTFENIRHSSERFMKFLTMSLVGLGINSSFVWILMHAMHQSVYIATLPMIFVTPALLFFINKFWVFKDTAKPIKLISDP